MFFSNGKPDQNKLSKDRWTILKISKDLTELTDIGGRKLEKRKEQIKHFGTGEVEPEKENIDSDASGKRKSSEMEADGQMSAKMPKSIIETNQQFGAGRVEPEKEKNPQQENVDEEVEEYVDISAFNGKLFTRQFKPTNSNNILTTGEKYKPKIREKFQEYINQGIRFYLVYKVELEKYDADWEEDTKTVYLNSANRRIFDMEQFDEVYDEAMEKINEEFEAWMGEASGWEMDRISSIDLNIARLPELQ